MTGTAMPKLGCTPGERDAKNAGKTPQDFQKKVNDFIRHRRDSQELTVQLPESHAFLDVNEVLAVRLYSVRLLASAQRARPRRSAHRRA